MSDSKYGRLWTDADVRALLERFGDPELYQDAVDPGEVLLERAMADGFTPTFPPDEPLFLLRGQDVTAPDVIASLPGDESRDYAEAALACGAPWAHCEAAVEAARAMRAWQHEHPDRVKVPD